MHSFISYWSKYEDEAEALDANRAAWSLHSISRGIVREALRGLASLLAKDELSADAVQSTGEGVLFIDRTLIVAGVRVSLLGLESDLGKGLIFRELEDRARENICLCVVFSALYSAWPIPGRDDNFGAGNIFSLYPSDVDAIARGEIDALELIEYKIFRRIIGEKPDSETQFHRRLYAEFSQTRQSSSKGLQGLDEYLDEISEDYRDWIDHPLGSRVSGCLERGRGCVLIGPSSSGKSVLALQVGRGLLLSGTEVLYSNLGRVTGFPSDLFKLLLMSDRKACCVLLADDIQSNPALARLIFLVSSAAKRVCVSTSSVVLGVSWVEFAREAVTWYEDCLPIAVRPHQIRQKLLREYEDSVPREDLKHLASRFGEDLFLLKLSLEQSKLAGRQVGPSELAQEIWKGKTNSGDLVEADAIRVALVAGSLGRYDIVVSPEFLMTEARTSEKTLSLLLESAFLRKYQQSLTIGHRSLCALLTDWLGARGGWSELDSLQGPRNGTAVVLDFLKSLGSSLAVSSLRALQARAGFKERPQLNRRAATIVEIWTAFNAVVERIEQQQAVDPTWGRSPASAMFAIESFMEIGRQDLAEQSLSFLRRQWSLKDGELRVFTNGITSGGDFQQIRATMKEDDELRGKLLLPSFWQPAEQIDMERFHRTWVGGVILCAEAAAAASSQLLGGLADAMEKQQLPEGAFYPARVPWCTARVLLGLAACGRTIDTSDSVKRAVDWLLGDEARGGGACIGGIWQSGTGRWNTELETTGMVLLALAAVGFDSADERLAPAHAFLLSQRVQWTTSGRELDGALAIQAFLETGGDWEGVAAEAQQLSRWARSESFWRTATLSSQESLNQSCRVAQIASHLISIGWAAVRSDLPAFLDALTTPYLFRDEMFETPAEATSIGKDSPARERAIAPDVVFERLRALDRISLRECAVVGKCRRFDERVRNRLRDWRARIVQPLMTPTQAHENFLIWAAPGSGKSFLVQETARTMGGTIEYRELNLARQPKEDFLAGIELIRSAASPTLVLIDEIDARSEESWPYESCFSLLDLNLNPNKVIVFVLVGSSSTGLQGMVRSIEHRSKGKDLLDRVPVDRRFEIPELSLEDKGVIFASQVVASAAASGRRINQIEKLALYYILSNGGLQTPRQVGDLAVSATQRAVAGDDRLKYDDLFFSGDYTNQQFWVEHQGAAGELSNVFVLIDE